MKYKPIWSGSKEYQEEVEAIRERGRHTWRLLRGSEVEREEGLRLVREDYEKEASPSDSMSLGVALLWLGRYAEAFEHFRSRIETDRMRGDIDYGMAGVAKWCLGEPREAVMLWQAGMKAPYARSGFAIRMPLLMFFASVVRPDVIKENDAKDLLSKMAENPKIENWPGTIAKLVLGRICDVEFQKSCKGANALDGNVRVWVSDFYKNLLGFEHMTSFAFKDFMRKLSDTTEPWWQEEGVFTSRLWREEFFLARYEGAARGT